MIERVTAPPPRLAPPSPVPRDRLGRRLRDLRVSVTDRCNFRCRYCMPRELFGESFRYLPHSQILTYEEVTRLATVFRGLGAEKMRITGGEPLLRRDLPHLVGMLAEQGLDLALTTNGSLLARLAAPLAAAGLQRITVSLDSLDERVFRRMNDVDFSVADVLAGIDAAIAAGLCPVKLNAVVRRGVNEHTIGALVAYGRQHGLVVRFIEFMDVGTTNGWRMADVVPARELLERLRRRFALEPVAPAYPGEVARRWRFADGHGEIGFIASVTEPFCGGCTRARLSADGKLFTCLFAAAGTDLRAQLRGGASDAELARLVAGVWERRDDRYSEVRTAETLARSRVEMSYIGG